MVMIPEPTPPQAGLADDLAEDISDADEAEVVCEEGAECVGAWRFA